MNFKSLLFILTAFLSSFAYAQNMQNLGMPINTLLTSEYSPSLNGNGRTMIFQATTGEDNKPEILISNAKSGVWSRPEAISTLTSNTKLVLSKDYFLTYDGNSIYFSSSRYGGVGSNDIWYVEKIGTTWGPAKNLAKPVNSIGQEADPSLSPDGKFLYFVRYTDKKSPSGQPCGKIYVSEKLGKDLWKEPKELPANINTGCECNPRILADNQTLIFASSRSGGKGGFDQYRTQLQDNGTWSTPVSMTFINTDKDDQYVSIPAQGDLIYYMGLGKNGPDIFKTKIPEELRPKKVLSIEGFIKDDAQKPISARVIVYDTKKNKLINIIQTNTEGRYMVYLAAGTEYDLSIISNTEKNYSYYSEFIDLDTLSKFKEIVNNIKLQPLKVNNSIALANIAFDQGTDKLLDRSSYEIGRIATLLKENPTSVIEIAVHTDNVITDSIQKPGLTEIIVDSIEVSDPSDSTGIAKIKIAKMTYHNNVTQKQADALINALLKKGITKERIIAKGYGNSKPIVPNNSDHNKALNRRIELIVIKP